MRKLLASLLGILAIASLAGCATDTQQPENETKTVKIWVIVPLSWPASNYGTDILNAYTYVVDQFNAAQSGLHIELVVEDGKCNGKEAASAAQKLITIDNVQVIVGGFCSAETIPAGNIAQTYHIPLLSPASSAPEISNIGTYVFKFYDDSYVSKFLADYVHTLQTESVIAIVEQSDACVGFSNAFAHHFSGSMITYSFASIEKDFSLLAKQVKSRITPSDFLLFLGCNDIAVIDGLQALYQEGILEMMQGRIAGNETFRSEDVFNTLGTKLNGMKTTQLKNTQYFPDSGKTLVDLFKDSFTIHTDILRMILWAEAMDLTIEAITKVGNNAEEIKNYFTSLSQTNPKVGYFGDYYFNEERTAEGLGFLVYEIQNGELIAVE